MHVLVLCLRQSLEGSLHKLVGFLETFAGRRKARGFSRAAGAAQNKPGARAAPGLFGGFAPGTAGLFGGPLGGGAAVGPYGGSSLEEVTGRAMNVMTMAGPESAAEHREAKRQKMMWDAYVVEEQRNAAVR